MNSEHDQAKKENLEEEVRSTVESGERIREEVRRIVLRAIQAGEATLGELVGISREVLESASESLEALSAEERKRRLEETISGLGDAFTSALNATGLALEEAKAKGEKFATEDLKATLEELQTLEKLFVETVSSLVGRSTSLVNQSTEELVTHARRIGESFRPALNAALESLRKQPMEFVEGATAAVAGVLSGVLQGVADALQQKPSKNS